MDNLINKIIDIETPEEEKDMRFILKDIVNKEMAMDVSMNPNEKSVRLDLTKLKTHFNYAFKFQYKSNGIWKDLTESAPLIPKFYNNENKLTYSFVEYPQSNKLLIVFSSSAHSDRYNYVKTVRDCKINKLFISDENTGFDDTTCSYYLGKNKQNSYEKKLISLIEMLLSKKHIHKKNVFLFGSSKGGFAALYYTFKYGFGNAIVGSPTIYLGKMHKDNERGRNIISTLAGEASRDNINWLDNLIVDQVKKSAHHPTLYYHVGKRETRYTRHAVHFLKELDSTDRVKYYLDLADYSNHSDVIKYFPPYAQKILSQISED